MMAMRTTVVMIMVVMMKVVVVVVAVAVVVVVGFWGAGRVGRKEETRAEEMLLK